jgi:hypothetical protein
VSYLLYSPTLETGASRSTSREAEGPALRSLGNLPPKESQQGGVVPNPDGCRALGREEKE